MDLAVGDLNVADEANALPSNTPKAKVSHLLKDNLHDGEEAKFI